MDRTGAVVIPARFERASVFQEGRASVRVDGRVGVIDPAGRLVVPPAYDSVDLFVEGRARVSVGEGERAVYGYIDPSGGEIVPPVLLEATVYGAGLGVAEVRLPVSGWVRQLASRAGLVRYPRQTVAVGLDGSVAVAFDHQSVGAFSEGLAPFQSQASRQWGYLAPDGSEAIAPTLGRAFGFSDGLAQVERDGQIGYIDTTGQPAFAATFAVGKPFAEGRAAVRVDNQWGFIDRSGAVVVALRFEFARAFSEGLAAVRVDGWWGYIGLDGEVEIAPTYSSAQAFRGGLALVSDASGTFYIDSQGRPVRPLL